MIGVRLGEGETLKVKEGSSGKEILEISSVKDKKTIVGMLVDGHPKDLSATIENDNVIDFLTFDDEQGLEIFRHSSAHLMAHAITQLYPDALLTIGPVVDEGFYYDFEMKTPLQPEDLKRIEKSMYDIMKKDLNVERMEISKAEAKRIFKDNPYKLEMIGELEGGMVSAYRQGDFIDLCRGPHVPRTGMLKAFKLTKIAGAYWRADSTKQQLQRVYGISFPEKDQLKEHLRIMEEAERRNHRKIGRQMELFDVFDEAPGMPFILPNGITLWRQIEGFLRDELNAGGYIEVQTPLLLKKDLWKLSGHWDHYKENMYFVKIDNEDFAIKPMNCPGHTLIYGSKVRSYRELPIRMAEFGLIHRHELSGVLNGLLRVRKFTMDDAHIFCTPDQLEQEIVSCIGLVDKVYRTFGFDYNIELSTRPEKSIGSSDVWENAEKALENALKRQKREFKVNDGDGAFYGPKIDFHIKDCLGRTWQCATIQVDFSMPERFNLTYMDKDGEDKHRPVMIHRAILGSFERFIGILIEHFAGKFPLWIAPRQVRILTINDSHIKFAEKVGEKMKSAGIRVDYDINVESVQKKVRKAQLDKVPIMITIGDKEQEKDALAVRTLDGKVKFGLPIDTFIKKIKENIDKREISFSLG